MILDMGLFAVIGVVIMVIELFQMFNNGVSITGVINIMITALVIYMDTNKREE